MDELPTGTVTFLFTDIEGSTRLLQTLGEGWKAVLEDHNRLLRGAISEAGGIALRTEGDSFFAVFWTVPAAVAAAARVSEPWPHTPGLPRRRSGSEWGCTRVRERWAVTTTSGWMSTELPG